MPLWPLPDVLPVPEPGPRPRRFRSRLLPGMGERLCRPILSVATVYSSTGSTSTRWRTCLSCPRSDGESCLITSSWWCLRPIASSVRFIRHECPMPLRTCRMRTFPVVSSFLPVCFGPLPGCHTNVRGMLHRLLRLGSRPVAELRGLDAALASDLVHRRQLRQSVHRRPHHVVRVGRAEALRQDVVDADALHHRADRATGDHAGARRRGLHPHLPRSVLARDFVRDRRSRQRHGDQVPARGLDGLANRLGDLVRLPRCEADLPLPIADGDERVEAEPASTLHDLRDTVDRDDVLDQIAPFAILTATVVATTSAATTTTAIAASLTTARTAASRTAAGAATTAATAAAR